MPNTAISSVEVVFTNGNKISFSEEGGLPLSQLKIAFSAIKEEVTSFKTSKTESSAT